MEIIPPQAILESSVPTDAAFRLFCILCSVKDSRNADVYLTREDAESKFGFSKSRYFEALKTLESLDWIAKSEKIGQLQYWFLVKGFDLTIYEMNEKQSRKWDDFQRYLAQKTKNSPENGTIIAKNSPENRNILTTSEIIVPKTGLESPENGTIVKKRVPKMGLSPTPPYKEKTLTEKEENKEGERTLTREEIFAEYEKIPKNPHQSGYEFQVAESHRQTKIAKLREELKNLPHKQCYCSECNRILEFGKVFRDYGDFVVHVECEKTLEDEFIEDLQALSQENQVGKIKTARSKRSLKTFEVREDILTELPEIFPDESPPTRAIGIWQEFYPNLQIDGGRLKMFAEELPDKDVDEIVWRETVKEWKLSGWNSTNFSDMVERYRKKVKKKVKGELTDGNSSNGNGKNRKPKESDEEWKRKNAHILPTEIE